MSTGKPVSGAFAKILAGDIDVTAIMDGLPFSEDTIAEAAITQTPLFSNAANLFMKLMRERMKLEIKLKQREANISLGLRKQAKEAGEKPTEGYFTAKGLNHPELIKLREELADAEVEEHAAKLLLETLRQRKSAIENVIDVRKTEAQLGFSFSSRIQQAMGATDVRAAMKNKYKGGGGR